MTEEEATLIVESLDGNLPFFPTKPAARSLIVAELADFCATFQQGLWLARRTVRLFKQWPGIVEMRAVYCSKYRAADGIEASSSVYPDGIPSENPAPLPRLPAPREMIEPPDLAAAKILEELAREVSTRAAAERAPKPRLFAKPDKPVTQEDIDAAAAARKKVGSG